MNDTELIHKIQSLKEIRPSTRLHIRMKTVLNTLPVQKGKGFSFFFAMRIGLIALVLFLVGTSGVVVAGTNARPGSVLFPVKKAFIKAQIIVATNPVKKATLQKQLEEPTAAPTPTPTKHEGGNGHGHQKDVHAASDQVQQHDWFESHGKDTNRHQESSGHVVPTVSFQTPFEQLHNEDFK